MSDRPSTLINYELSYTTYKGYQRVATAPAIDFVNITDGSFDEIKDLIQAGNHFVQVKTSSSATITQNLKKGIERLAMVGGSDKVRTFDVRIDPQNASSANAIKQQLEGHLRTWRIDNPTYSQNQVIISVQPYEFVP